MKKENPTILMVEDDPNDQFLMTRGFRKVGVTTPIHIVNNGLEAIAYMMGEGQYADRSRFAYPTFVMTDLKMPEADGFAVLEFLMGNPEWAVIPTIVFSGSADQDDIKKAYMLGASSYHVKPSSPDDLAHQLEVLHSYWITCEVPAVDRTGKQLHTESHGKLGERFEQPGDEKGPEATPDAPHPIPPEGI
ncbi:CheY chemotaxis protein or a CheY-like REC (receiver) domain [Verrucomicrobium sp. GAS474]|uniref:response regulator n=1 Tax=Verrucomicrobium sp. GAS474 TaxID=1882831 RepID=UPI00087B41D3|nr:response regulator [Verrucomicrobium sp. GAS474]SDU26586.1 CheY chemotaxis protein or a CheY-like REC (receiver) domain [Verrucomicrobium sp. GAS474]